MNTHRHDAVNPLVNPVRDQDTIIAESGDIFRVFQKMDGFHLIRERDGLPMMQPEHSQIAVCSAIDNLANY